MASVENIAARGRAGGSRKVNIFTRFSSGRKKDFGVKTLVKRRGPRVTKISNRFPFGAQNMKARRAGCRALPGGDAESLLRHLLETRDPHSGNACFILALMSENASCVRWNRRIRSCSSMNTTRRVKPLLFRTPTFFGKHYSERGLWHAGALNGKVLDDC